LTKHALLRGRPSARHVIGLSVDLAIHCAFRWGGSIPLELVSARPLMLRDVGLGLNKRQSMGMVDMLIPFAAVGHCALRTMRRSIVRATLAMRIDLAQVHGDWSASPNGDAARPVLPANQRSICSPPLDPRQAHGQCKPRQSIFA
jgi:hypothetical protein